MGRTVCFESRMIGDPVRTLDVRCDDLRFEHGPDIVQRGAGGDVQRSILPFVVTLVAVHPRDLAAMLEVDWTHMGWNEGEQTRTYATGPIQILGNDVRCIYKP